MSINPVQEVVDLHFELKTVIDKFVNDFTRRARDEYVGSFYRTDYTVMGRGAFPIDMLRYSNAWPKGEEDAGQIERSHEGDVEATDPFTISLTKYHRDPTPQLSHERWESKFRWKIIIASIETTRL